VFRFTSHAGNQSTIATILHSPWMRPGKIRHRDKRQFDRRHSQCRVYCLDRLSEVIGFPGFGVVPGALVRSVKRWCAQIV
jgi:hypothetical protein